MSSWAKLIPGLSIAFFALSVSSAHSQTAPTEGLPKIDMAQPLLIVRPEFPSQIPPGTLPLEVRISGRISAEGILESPVFDPTKANEEFLSELRDVLPRWRFRPKIDFDNCKAVDSQSEMTVYFELKNGRPAFFVSSPVIPIESDEAKQHMPGKGAFVRGPTVSYPRQMMRQGIEGFTEVLVQMNENGEITKKVVVFSIPHWSFGNTVVEDLKSSMFAKKELTEATGVPPKTMCYFLPVIFCLSNFAGNREPRCLDGHFAGMQITGTIIPASQGIPNLEPTTK